MHETCMDHEIPYEKTWAMHGIHMEHAWTCMKAHGLSTRVKEFYVKYCKLHYQPS